MLAFIDESGHPHPNDPCQRPVVVSVCLDETDGRSIAARIHGLKRDLLGQERMELKANNLINRHTFRRKPKFVSFLEEFYNTLLNLPVTIFAMIMEKPFENRQFDEDYLPNRFRFLVQRIELLAKKSATLWLPSCLTVQLDCMVDWAGNSTAIFIVLKKGEHSDILLMCRPSLIRGHLLEFKSRTWWHRLSGNTKKLNCIDRRLKWGTLIFTRSDDGTTSSIRRLATT